MKNVDCNIVASHRVPVVALLLLCLVVVLPASALALENQVVGLYKTDAPLGGPAHIHGTMTVVLDAPLEDVLGVFCELNRTADLTENDPIYFHKAVSSPIIEHLRTTMPSRGDAYVKGMQPVDIDYNCGVTATEVYVALDLPWPISDRWSINAITAVSDGNHAIFSVQHVFGTADPSYATYKFERRGDTTYADLHILMEPSLRIPEFILRRIMKSQLPDLMTQAEIRARRGRLTK